nr:zinc finger, CCHC-type [Tanacetum cinerariifolium]
AVVRLSNPKRKTLGKKGIDCIFVGYAEHSKAYRFYVIEPNDTISINSIIESKDAIFDENRFSSIPRPKDIIPNSIESQRDYHSNDVPSETPEPRKGSKWIFKRKMKFDGTIDKFKVRLVIQGFRQKEGTDCFDTYAPVARITKIRLFLALEAIQNLVIHQTDAKTAFLNGDMDEKVYMKQPKGFVMPYTRPPMLDRTDFASWQQPIRLYCRGKYNRVNILKSIDEGPYKLEHLGKTLLRAPKELLKDRESQLYDEFEHFRQHKEESINDYYVRFSKLINDMRNIKMTMPQLQLNSKFVNNMLPEWVQDDRAVVQNVQGRPNRGQGMNPWGGNAAGYGEAQNRVGNVNQGQARPSQARTVKCYNCNGGPHNAFDDDVDEQPIQDLALNVDNVFQAEDCDAFDSDVDEAPTAQTMFMANLSSADPIIDEAEPSYDSDILSEVQDHDQYLDDTCAYQEEHMMHDSVQLDHVVDLHADHTSISNMIPYDQYVKDNDVSVVHINTSSVSNDTFMMIYHDMCEPIALSESNSSQNTTVKNSLTAKLATYREQVELPRPLYNDLNKVAIGYKNPLCLTPLKERAKVSRPIKAFIVYPPNTPATLVPRVLPTTSQVKIHIFTLIQQFLEIDKTCKKRITPSAITDGERGFEQTKACYLQEVIPFFQTIKDNFEGIQKALTREVKQMKDVFEELEAEVAQCAVDRKHDAIDHKNLFIANDNLITECLSKEVFSMATKSELNVV